MNIQKAFLYGALLTDGCIKKHKNREKWYNYEIQADSIDIEYLQAIKKAWQDTYNLPGGSIYLSGKGGEYNIRGKIGKKKPSYRWTTYGKEIAEEILKETEDKKKIPGWIMNGADEIKKSFIGSALDGNGYISIMQGRKGQSLHFEAGFSHQKPVIEQFKELLDSVGIKCYKLRKYDNADCHKFRFNTTDLANSGIKFSIIRKQEKLNKIIKILRDYTLDNNRKNT